MEIIKMDWKLTKKGEIYENSYGQLVFVCCICDAIQEGLQEVETHLKTHIDSVIIETGTEDEDDLSTLELNSNGTVNGEKIYIKIENIESDYEQEDDMRYDKYDEMLTHLNDHPLTQKREIIDIKESKPREKLKNSKRSSSRFYPTSNHYLCDLCNRVFARRQLLVVHMNRHSFNKSFDCYICGHVFADKKNLTDHLNRHNQLKRFNCDECGKTFVTSVELRSHIRSHTGERNYTCAICGKRFATSGLCTRHVQRVHSKEKRFFCNYLGCHQSFFKNADLQIHVRCHTGERPLSCNICSRTFANPKVLQAHKKLHKPEKEYKCKFCPNRFSQSSGRRGHERRVHGAV